MKILALDLSKFKSEVETNSGLLIKGLFWRRKDRYDDDNDR